MTASAGVSLEYHRHETERDLDTPPGRAQTWTITVPESEDRIIVHCTGPEPAWLRPVISRLVELLRLPAGWNSYGASAVQIGAVEAALRVLIETMQSHTPAPSIVPTSHGGVQLEWHTREIDLEVEVTPTGHVTAAYECEPNGREWEADLSADLAPLVSALDELSPRT